MPLLSNSVLTVDPDIGGGGGSGDLTKIAETVLGADGAITFSSIAGTYQDLLIVGRVRGANAVNSATLTMRVGNSTLDTGSNYSYGSYYERSGGSDAWLATATATYGALGLMNGNNNTAGLYNGVTIWIFDYADTSYNRSIHAHITGYGSTANGSHSCSGSSLWNNTADAIDIIEFQSDSFSNDLEAGSRLVLYGVG